MENESESLIEVMDDLLHRVTLNSINENNIITIQKNIRSYLSRKRTVIDIINKINWEKLIDLYNIFGESLNENDMKFMKGKLYELFVVNSHNYFVHINITGCDITCLGIKIELKFQQKMLLNKKRDLKPNITFRCKNSNGSNKTKLSLNNTSSIYILIQRDAIAYVTRYNVLKNLRGTSDLEAKIPSDSINIIWKNDDNVEIVNSPQINISNIITMIYNCICKSLWYNKDYKVELKKCLYEIADNL